MAFPKPIAGTSALAVAMLLGSDLSVLPAQAAYIVTLAQVGGNVVATGSGSIGLAGLTFVGGSSVPSYISPSEGTLFTGLSGLFDTYSGFTGPRSFGTGA